MRPAGTRGGVQLVTCRELIEELAEKLEARLHFSAEQVVETIADYLGFLQVIRIPVLQEL